MSLVGQVDWYFQVTVCACDTCGIAIVAAPVAPAASRNLRRVGLVFDVMTFALPLDEAALLAAIDCMNRRPVLVFQRSTEPQFGRLRGFRQVSVDHKGELSSATRGL